MDPADNPESRGGYRKTFDQYGPSPQALQWVDYRSAALRYRQLLVDIALEGRSILDIGCGMGDLVPFIYAQTDSFKYLGIDITPEFIEVAKKRYAGHDFKVFDPFKEDLGRTFDVVVLCGAMNANKKDWLENRKQKIQKLYELANEAVVFNMAGALEPIAADERVAYADPQEILEFCRGLSKKVILKTHYHPRDFTIVMFKQSAPE